MLEKNFPATDDALPGALAWVEELLGKVDCPARPMAQLAIAVEEIFVNIAHYGYPAGPGDVLLRADVRPGEATFQFIDRGIPFDPLAREDPDVTALAEDRQIGGLGIYMVKKTMDSVRYERSGDRNVFTMTRRLQ